jgi:hypothetical protein
MRSQLGVGANSAKKEGTGGKRMVFSPFQVFITCDQKVKVTQREVYSMRTMAALVFPEFQTLDFFGPIEMLGGFRDEIEIVTVAKEAGPVASRHGQRIVVDKLISRKEPTTTLTLSYQAAIPR